MKRVWRFLFGSVTADILMLIGVVLLGVSLHFRVNAVEVMVVDPSIRGTWFHMLLLITTMPALMVLLFAGYGIVAHVLAFFVQFCLFLALGRLLAFLLSIVVQQKSNKSS